MPKIIDTQIDFAANRLTNIAEAVEATDAVPLGQVQSLIAASGLTPEQIAAIIAIINGVNGGVLTPTLELVTVDGQAVTVDGDLIYEAV